MEEAQIQVESAAFGTQRLRTSVFASSRIERMMRRNTFQTKDTGEPLLDEGSSSDNCSGSRWRLPIFTGRTHAKGIGAFASRDLQEAEFIGDRVQWRVQRSASQIISPLYSISSIHEMLSTPPPAAAPAVASEPCLSTCLTLEMGCWSTRSQWATPHGA